MVRVGLGWPSMYAEGNSSLLLRNSPGREPRSLCLGLVPVSIVRHQPLTLWKNQPCPPSILALINCPFYLDEALDQITVWVAGWYREVY